MGSFLGAPPGVFSQHKWLMSILRSPSVANKRNHKLELFTIAIILFLAMSHHMHVQPGESQTQSVIILYSHICPLGVKLHGEALILHYQPCHMCIAHMIHM